MKTNLLARVFTFSQEVEVGESWCCFQACIIPLQSIYPPCSDLKDNQTLLRLYYLWRKIKSLVPRMYYLYKWINPSSHFSWNTFILHLNFEYLLGFITCMQLGKGFNLYFIKYIKNKQLLINKMYLICFEYHWYFWYR